MTKTQRRRMARKAEKHLLDLCVLQGFKCCLCGCTMIMRKQVRYRRNPLNKATVDHIIPLSEGGNSKIGNLRAACAQCNNLRSNGK